MRDISVVDIILAVDEPIDATQCGGKENCHNDQRCMTHDLWANLNARIRDYLALVTLEQLVANPKVKDIAVLQDMRAHKQPYPTAFM
jgi:Rrf2 family iron-sulfur cluster assembly transcriptional regulator